GPPKDDEADYELPVWAGVLTGLANGDTYQIDITGDFPHFSAGGSTKLQSIEQWGGGRWASMFASFNGCSNLRYNATDAPDLSNVTTMQRMFDGCTNFNGNIGSWNTSTIVNMRQMFNNASSFNQDLSNWNTAVVTDMVGMFSGASSFDQNLGNWDIGNVASMASMLDNSGLSKANYDATLIGWADNNGGTQTIPTNISLGAVGLEYCGGEAARNALISTYSWIITGDSRVCSGVPEIDVLGNGISIVDGDISPNVSDGTDFGSVAVSGGNQTETFSIENTGTGTLDVTSINLSGVSGGDFSVGAIALPTSIAVGASTTFTITFTPSASGTRDAAVTINNNDSDEAAYNFTIQGIGTSTVVGANAFRTTWITNDGTITIPTLASSGSYNYNITWINLTTGASNSVTGQTGDYTITGLTNGDTYEVAITGDFPHFYMEKSLFFNSSAPEKLQTIEQWGDIAWSSMRLAFTGCSNLTYNATDAPNLSGVTDMRGMFLNCVNFNGNIGNWNTATITNMDATFSGCTSFNGNIGGWNTSNVTDMGSMFVLCTNFNQDISGWNTSSVDDMGAMFSRATVFNQNIGNWNTAAVITMGSMFSEASSFNQDISGWNTSAVTNMNGMLDRASSFNQNIGAWDIGNVINMGFMLVGSGLSKANYDATLIGWADDNDGVQNIPTMVNLSADGLEYCAGETARNTLISTYNWTITGDSRVCSGTPEITFTPSPADLGTVTVGTNTTQSYVIENTGSATLTVSSIISSNPTVFSIQNAPISISAGATVSFEVVFAPTSAGGTNTDITISSDASNSPTVVFSVTGTGSAPLNPSQTNFYVSLSGNNTTADSWVNAYTSLETALSQATAGDTIFVAAGTYYPSAGLNLSTNSATSTVRYETFLLPNGVQIYGGFAGNESPITQATLDARNFTTNETILSGDFSNDDVYNVSTAGSTSVSISGISENAYHVIATRGADASMVLDGFTVKGGAANGDNIDNQVGGAWYNNGNNGFGGTGSPTVRNVTFENNFATLYGAGVIAFGTTVSPNFENCLFTQNKAERGAAYYSNQDMTTSEPTFTNCDFTQNEATFIGGAIYYNAETTNTAVVNPTRNPRFKDCDFENNRANGSGGAIFIFSDAASGTVTLGGSFEGCRFEQNDASFGGAMYNEIFRTEMQTNFQNTRFTLNEATNRGGAMCNFGSTGSTIIPSFISTQFTDNRAGAGGAIYNDAQLGGEISLQVNGGFFFSNFSLNFQGGAIANVSTSGGTNFSTFSNRTGFEANNAANNGGAIHNLANGGEVAINVVDAMFTLNEAGNIGGAIVNYAEQANGQSSSNYTNVEFSQNTAVNGGGAVADIAESSTSTVCTTNYYGCTFVFNATTDFGGAIYATTTGGSTLDVKLFDCKLRTNSTNSFGGGIFVSGSSTGGNISNLSLEFDRTEFLNNSAGTSAGGVMYINGNTISPQIKFSNSVFGQNTATFGPAIYLHGSILPQNLNVELENCSFAQNNHTSPRPVVYFDPIDNTRSISAQIENSIFWDHTGSSWFVNNVGLVSVSASHTLIAETVLPANTTDGGGNLFNTNPLFVNAGSNNLRLQAGSPAIDSGLASLNNTPKDADRHDRLQGSMDMGAYEFVTQTDFYVAATGGNNINSGADWNNALATLGEALNRSDFGDRIFVARGTYYPETELDLDGSGGSDPRERTFNIPDGVEVYGGFAGNEASITQTVLDNRDFVTNETILSGDFNNDDSYTVTPGTPSSINVVAPVENAYHVVYTFGISEETLVSGFTITGGAANGPAPNGETFFFQRGGGWFNDGSGAGNASLPQMDNLRFENNMASNVGGAFYSVGSFGGDISNQLTNCTFTGNICFGLGGAVHLDAFQGGTVNPSFSLCSFIANTANFGGAIFAIPSGNAEMKPTFLRCEFSQNAASSWGGAFASNTGSDIGSQIAAEFDRCTFTGNFGQFGGAVINATRNQGLLETTFKTCVFTNNRSTAGGNAVNNFCPDNSLLNPRFLSCSFGDNTEANGGIGVIATFGNQGDVVIRNSVFGENGGAASLSANNSVSYNLEHVLLPETASQIPTSNAQNVFFESEAFFNDAINGDLTLKPCSPAIDAGSNALVAGQIQDIIGNTRIQNGTVDLGAYESDPNVPIPTPEISISVSPTSVMEDSSMNFIFTFLSDEPVCSDLTVNFTVSGDVDMADYSVSGATTFGSSTGTITILAGTNTAILTITPNSDTDVEIDEDIIVTVTP
ncbi:MAG: BspA family leucine-rich repeat surface protein, partial [Bacteroidota bacterium]